MIQANELRIGNWVFLKDTYQYVQIDIINNIHQVVFVNMNIFAPVDIKDLKEIPITDVLMLKCGFEWDAQKNSFTLGDICVKLYDNYCILHIENVLLDKMAFAPLSIHSLHQFQNVYFSLTNKEISIKLC